MSAECMDLGSNCTTANPKVGHSRAMPQGDPFTSMLDTYPNGKRFHSKFFGLPRSLIPSSLPDSSNLQRKGAEASFEYQCSLVCEIANPFKLPNIIIKFPSYAQPAYTFVQPVHFTSFSDTPHKCSTSYLGKFCCASVPLTVQDLACPTYFLRRLQTSAL